MSRNPARRRCFDLHFRAGWGIPGSGFGQAVTWQRRAAGPQPPGQLQQRSLAYRVSFVKGNGARGWDLRLSKWTSVTRGRSRFVRWCRQTPQ